MDMIKHMVDRFLMWPLPNGVNPDGGISIDASARPVGTNLLSAVEADAMVRHMLDGLWQHIETAPRDGTPFLCFRPDDLFSPQTGIDLVWYEPHMKTFTMDGDTEVPFAGITHWMPLPSAPTHQR
jgi:hypothetical protein